MTIVCMQTTEVAIAISPKISHTLVRKVHLERWLSGRKRQVANLLYGVTTVSRVRIPPSPPIETSSRELILAKILEQRKLRAFPESAELLS